jgi:hypothetical protein
VNQREKQKGNDEDRHGILQVLLLVIFYASEEFWQNTKTIEKPVCAGNFRTNRGTSPFCLPNVTIIKKLRILLKLPLAKL